MSHLITLSSPEDISSVGLVLAQSPHICCSEMMAKPTEEIPHSSCGLNLTQDGDEDERDEVQQSLVTLSECPVHSGREAN